jgi:predicted Zn finger-like uncharacterized protein
MNIECTSCQARYTIADSLVPPQGARVRCRKCGEVMQVKSPAPLVMPSELPLVPPSPESPVLPAAEPAPQAAAAPPPSPPPSSPQPAPPDSGGAFERFPSQETASERPAEPEFERFAAFSAPSVETAPAAPPRAAPAPPAFGASPFPAEPSPAQPPPFPAQQAPAQPPPFPAQQAPAPFPAQQAPAPAAPRAASAPPANAPDAAAPRPRISASAVPEGLTPEEMQRHEKARRLARVLASDIAIYNREKRERGIKDGNLVAVLGYEIKKSWETYKERVGADFANTTPYFRDALNEIVAEGKKIF